MRRTRSFHLFLAGISLTLIAAAACLVLAVQREADTQNHAAIETQQRIARSLMNAAADSLSTILTSETFWDEAYDGIVAKWNPRWIGWEYGGHLKSIDVHKGMIFGPDRKLLYAFENDDMPALGRARLASHPDIARLAEDARRHARDGETHVSRGFVLIGGHPAIAAAAPVMPEMTRASLPPSSVNGQYIVVFVRALGSTPFARIGEYANASAFEVLPAGVSAPRGKISIPLATFDDREVARLWWVPNRPGASMTRRLVPLAVLIFAGLGAITAFIFHAWRVETLKAGRAEALVIAAHEESRSKTAFLASLSHDLRTPLNAIIGFSEVMRGQTRGPLDPRYLEYVDHIHHSGTHLLRIINDLLDVARMDSGRAEVECIDTDAARIAADAVGMLQTEAARANITLIGPDEEAAGAWCDPRALLRIVINLVGNAIKFTPPGGMVRVAVESDAAHVRVRVTDTGIGILPEDVQKLGRPFTQVGDHLTNHKQGSGLGLSICKGLLEMMGGDLVIASQFGAGTSVTAVLPRHAPGAAQTGTPAVKAA